MTLSHPCLKIWLPVLVNPQLESALQLFRGHTEKPHLDESWATFLYSLKVLLTPTSYPLKAGPLVTEQKWESDRASAILEKYPSFSSEIALLLVPDQNLVISKTMRH